VNASSLLQGWTLDSAVLITIAIGTALWLRGRAVLEGLAAAGEVGWTDRWWYVPSFVSALAVMIAASCSPIDAYSAQLFWVHMIQHLLLLMLVAPLLAAAAPWLPLWYGLPSTLRRGIERTLGSSRRGRPRPGRWWAVVFLLLFIVGTWIWHLPNLYDLALSNDVVHDYGEHNTFLLVGVLFWLQIIPSAPFRPLLGTIGRGAFMLVAIAQNVVLSVVLAFAGRPLYTPYVDIAHRPGGLTALMDQQLGAAIMWSVGDLPFVIALVALVMTVLNGEFAEVQAEEPTPTTPVASRTV
jgi:cytochrome c oxidase assembly factor CtaG